WQPALPRPKIAPLLLVRCHRVLGHLMIAHQGWPHPQEHLEGERDLVAVITIESFRHIVDRDLSSQPYIDPPAMRKIAHITERVSLDRKDPLFVDRIEDQFVARPLDMLEPRIDRVPPALVIRLHQERLRLAVPAIVVLSPN